MASIKSYRIFILLSLSAAISHAVVYNKQTTFHGGKYKLYWAFNSSEDKIHFKVEAETNGYVALGFSNKGTGMENLDCVVAGVGKSGKGYIMDLKASGKTTPAKDQQQDYNLENSLETGSKTTVEFSRKRETGDNVQDMSFVSGQAVHVAWAYGLNDAATYSDFNYHQEKGYSPQMLVFVPIQPNPTATSTPGHQDPSSASVKPNLNITATSKPSPSSSLTSSSKMFTTITVSPKTNNPNSGSQASCNSVCYLALLLVFLISTLFKV